jgi:peptidoglycan/LPS O-acetylase OafA/YrhL
MAKGDDRAYFPYIDGLRALSIVAVILFHLDPGLAPGGFSGVDVFFVVSGFVVSSTLYPQKSSGFLALAALFYSRRFRRIAPAALLMLLTTSLAVVLFIPEAFLSNNIRRTAIAAFFGLSNFSLASGPDYFAPQAEFNPFTHTWSLAVEEQFYLIFPILIFLLTSGGKMMRGWAIGLLILCVLSFTYGFVEPSISLRLGFYSPLSRIWEIGAGVLIFAFMNQVGLLGVRAKPPPELQISTYAGVVLIASALAVGSAQTYPVPGAAFPVAGALLVIAGLHGRMPLSPVGKALSNRHVGLIGQISYSLYLWHWPIFVLFRWTVGFNTPVKKLIALAIAVLLSLISYLLVEKPLRTMSKLRKPLHVIPVSVLAVALCAWTADRMFGNYRLLSFSTVTANRAEWYPDIETKGKGVTDCRVEWQTQRLKIGVSLTSHRINCDGPDADKRLFVVGDSHATAYSSMLADYARLTRVSVGLYQTPGCYFVHLVPSAAGCGAVVDVVLDEIRKTLRAGDVVFMPSLRVPRFQDQWSERELDTAVAWKGMTQSSEAGFEEAVAIFEKLKIPGVHFLFEMPKPIFATPLFRCSDWFNRTNPACRAGTEMSRVLLERHRQPVRVFAERLHSRIVGFSTWDPFLVLCPAETCSMLKKGKPLFFDGDHISGYANRLLLLDFIKKIDELETKSTG